MIGNIIGQCNVTSHCLLSIYLDMVLQDIPALVETGGGYWKLIKWKFHKGYGWKGLNCLKESSQQKRRSPKTQKVEVQLNF